MPTSSEWVSSTEALRALLDLRHPKCSNPATQYALIPPPKMLAPATEQTLPLGWLRLRP